MINNIKIFNQANVWDAVPFDAVLVEVVGRLDAQILSSQIGFGHQQRKTFFTAVEQRNCRTSNARRLAGAGSALKFDCPLFHTQAETKIKKQ